MADPTPAQIAADTLLLAAMTGVARAENRNAYQKVNTATEFHHRWTRRRPQVSADPGNASPVPVGCRGVVHNLHPGRRIDVE